MEESISARLYKGLEGGGWRQADLYPEERDSFHYRTSGKKEGANKNQSWMVGGRQEFVLL